MMPVQPVGGRVRPSKAVWETRCPGRDGLGTDGPRVFRTTGRMHRPSGGELEARELRPGPLGAVPDSSTTGFQRPLDSR